MSRTAIACALCLLLAGCAAPTAPTGTPTAAPDGPATTATPTETSSATTSTTANTDDSTTDANESNRSALGEIDIAVSGGTIPVDHERVFARTTRLLGVNVTPPTVLVVQSPAEIRADTGGVSTPGNRSGRRSFVTVMGIGQDGQSETDGSDGADGGTEGDSDDESDEGDSDEGVSVAAYAPSAHSVIVNERMTEAGRESALERTLAHEFVHTVQFRQDAFERVQDALDLRERYSRDRYFAYLSVVEGTAVFVAQTYDRRYLAGNWATITSAERYRSASSGVKYSIARYYFGSRYLDARYDSAANVSAVYDDPPTTTEQLLHNDTDGSEMPARLSLSVFPGENRTRGRTNTNGELFTRIALGTELNVTRAAAAAEGWGADQLVSVTPRNRTRNRSFVWATRWDSRSEADEFAGALDAYLDSRANRSGGVWRDDAVSFRVVRLSEETVVLLAGTDSFVGNASVSGTNSSVTVSGA